MGKKSYWVRAGQEGIEEDPEKVLESIMKSIDKLYPKYIETGHFKSLSKVQKEESGFIIETFSEMMYDYHELKPHEWDAQTAEECCKYTLVRKVSAGEDYYKSLVPVLVSFFRFLQEQDVITNAEVMSKRLIKIESSIIKISRDSSNWGFAKSFVMGARQDGVDLLNEKEMAQYAAKKQQEALSDFSFSKMKGNERNLPCPCGSGNKYKKCCGKI